MLYGSEEVIKDNTLNIAFKRSKLEPKGTGYLFRPTNPRNFYKTVNPIPSFRFLRSLSTYDS